MSVILGGGWRGQLLDQVKKANATVFQLASSKQWDFIISLLDDYNEAAAEAMGSISARGGYPTIEFRSTKVHEAEWKKLSRWTVAFKNGVDTQALMSADNEYRQQVLNDAWSEHASSTPIWAYEGGAEASLEANYRKGQAGIMGPAYGYASVIEEGGQGSWGKKEIPARPLFSALNTAFENHIRQQLSNKKSVLYKEIQREFMARGNWK